MRADEIRKLTAREIAAVPKAIAAGINLTEIEIHKRRWTILTPPNVTVARGYRIYWPHAGEEAALPSHLAHLIHEITHVWQYKYLGVGMYSLRWLDRRYGYVLESGDQFFRYGLEQQASIIEDSVLARQGYKPRRARNSPAPALYDMMLAQIERHEN